MPNNSALMMTPHGYVHWNELMTNDIGGTQTFYAKALGWTFSPMPMGDSSTYWIIHSGQERPVGGMFDPSGNPDIEETPPHWMLYVNVDDIEDRVAKAQAAGGTLARPVFHVPGVGRIAMIQQPDGAMIGWMTAEPPSAG